MGDGAEVFMGWVVLDENTPTPMGWFSAESDARVFAEASKPLVTIVVPAAFHGEMVWRDAQNHGRWP